eukprot:3076209-Amphidinium_carterae.1
MVKDLVQFVLNVSFASRFDNSALAACHMKEQKDRLRKVLLKSFMFSNLDDQENSRDQCCMGLKYSDALAHLFKFVFNEDLTTVIGAMKE